MKENDDAHGDEKKKINKKKQKSVYYATRKMKLKRTRTHSLTH